MMESKSSFLISSKIARLSPADISTNFRCPAAPGPGVWAGSDNAGAEVGETAAGAATIGLLLAYAGFSGDGGGRFDHHNAVPPSSMIAAIPKIHLWWFFIALIRETNPAR